MCPEMWKRYGELEQKAKRVDAAEQETKRLKQIIADAATQAALGKD
jgi:hypothetical protein